MQKKRFGNAASLKAVVIGTYHVFNLPLHRIASGHVHAETQEKMEEEATAKR